MILIPDHAPTRHDRPDSDERPRPRSVQLGLERMDFRHALARPGLGRHLPTPALPRRGPDPQAPDWLPL